MLFRSEDFGSAWKKMADFGVNDIKINPAFPNELYVGGSAGVYKSVNFGTNLTEFNTGLVVKSVNSLDMIPINKTLYAGTSGGGIYKNCQMDLYLLTLNTTTGGTTIPTPGIYAYSKAEKIEINARPLTHYSFSGWSGDVSSFANPVIITMNADKSLTANFIRNLYAPLNFTGTKTENRYLFRVEYINVLRWEKNPDNEDSIKYRIYLIEGSTRKLLAEVSATTSEYWHRNLEKDKEYTYALVALDETGREGAAVYIAVR